MEDIHNLFVFVGTFIYKVQGQQMLTHLEDPRIVILDVKRNRTSTTTLNSFALNPCIPMEHGKGI